MNYKFPEARLDNKFSLNNLEPAKQLIEASISFNLVGMPAIGISNFLKYLCSQDLAYFVHVDLYELKVQNQENFFQLLLSQLGGKPSSDTTTINLCRKQLESLVAKQEKIVIIFNRFDQLKSAFNKDLFNQLHQLRNINKQKIVMIFATNKPLYTYYPQAFADFNMNMYSKILYLQAYTDQDLLKLFKIYQLADLADPKLLKSYLNLAGGHFNLLQLLVKSNRRSDYLADYFISAQLKKLYDDLSFKQRKQLQAIAQGKTVKAVDEYLLNVGYVQKTATGFDLFTPLFADYVKSQVSLRLPQKEAKLFKLLKANLQNLVSKDLIFETIWSDDQDSASDWALNALIYRLRKNPAFIQSGYIIESYKKEGYLLHQN